MNGTVVRAWWLGGGLAGVGAVIGLLVALLGSSPHRAEAAVLISSPNGVEAVRPQLTNVRELAESSLVAGNVRNTLRMSESSEHLRRRLHASIRPDSQVIVVAASDRSAERARQIAQEAAAVLTQLVEARFGNATPPLNASVLDPAHSLSGSERHVLRDTLLGAGLGALLGLAGFGALGSSRVLPVEPRADRKLRNREQVLERRIELVSARERAVARLAGELAAQRVALGAEVVGDEAVSPAEPAPSVEPSAGTAVGQDLNAQPRGRLNVNDLERLVEAKSDAAPHLVDEWRTYLYFLRQYAAIDGTLPDSFGGLVSDVFGELSAVTSNSADRGGREL